MNHKSIGELDSETIEILADKITDKLLNKQNEQTGLKEGHLYHNTRLLLRNYHQLKAHTDSVKTQINEDYGTSWGHKYLKLNSLMENRAKTVKIMQHVDNALDRYRELCLKSKDRGYNLIYAKFIGDTATDEALASIYGVSRQGIAKQLKDSIDELSVILYGVDALKLK